MDKPVPGEWGWTEMKEGGFIVMYGVAGYDCNNTGEVQGNT